MTVHTENEALFQRASRCLAGGVLSNFKKAKGVAPVYVKSAEGCRMTDYDGNVYYDFSLSAGPAILGHSNEGLRRALPEAELVPYPGISSVQYLAARLGMPWQDWRFVSAHGADADPGKRSSRWSPAPSWSASPSPAWTQSSTPSGWPGLIQDAPCM